MGTAKPSHSEQAQEIAMSFLDSHEDGCTPLTPCRHCQALAFLTEKLGRNNLDQFLTLLGLKEKSELKQSLVEQVPLDTPLATLEQFSKMSVRAQNSIKGENIATLRELVGKSERDLNAIPNFGRHSFNEIEQMLSTCGYRVGELSVK